MFGDKVRVWLNPIAHPFSQRSFLMLMLMLGCDVRRTCPMSILSILVCVCSDEKSSSLFGHDLPYSQDTRIKRKQQRHFGEVCVLPGPVRNASKAFASPDRYEWKLSPPTGLNGRHLKDSPLPPLKYYSSAVTVFEFKTSMIFSPLRNQDVQTSLEVANHKIVVCVL